MNLNEWHETGDRFNWRGQQVFYQEAGEGETLFLLHGFLTSSWLYKYLWPILSKHFRVVAPDFMGFGYSSKPVDYPYGINERVDMIYALAKLLKIEKAHFLSHSFGVNIVQELMSRQLNKSSSISILSSAMLNGALFIDQSKPGYQQRLLLLPLVGKLIVPLLGRRTYKSALSSRVGKYSTFPDDLMNDLLRQLLWGGGVALIRKINLYIIERKKIKKKLEKALLETDVPVQLIWGIDKEDQIAGIRLAHKYREHKGDQYVVMLKDIGHFPMVECPELVAEYYLNFIKGIRLANI